MKSPLAAGVDTGAYTDLNRLNQFKVGGDSEANIKKVAQEFESLFVNEMLKTMRKANEAFAEGNFLNSSEGKTYQDMHDQQLAITLSKQGNGIGLASVLERQLSGMKSTPQRVNPFAQVAAPVANTGFKDVGEGSSASGARNDVALLNQRRLSLPVKLTDRLLAGIVPSAEDTSLASPDWASSKKALVADMPKVTLDNSDATSGRRLAQPPLAKGKSVFSSAAEFIQTMLPMAEQAAQKIGVDARYLVAQAALETGWGKSIIRQGDGTSSHNLFGIKSHGTWQGESARVLTTEYRDGQAVKERANFRAYESYQQSFNDYVSFLQSNGRYEKALASTESGERFVRELQSAGYATDPNYANKISQIARKMQTYQAVASASDLSNRG